MRAAIRFLIALLLVLHLSEYEASAEARAVEQQIARYAQTVARRLDRSRPIFTRWEYAAVDAVPDRDDQTADLVNYVILNLENAIVDQGLRYVSPSRRDVLLAEMEFSQSEEARRLQAIRSGRMLAVDVLAFVDVARVSGSLIVSTAAVEVRSGRTLFAETTAFTEILPPDALVITADHTGWALALEALLDPSRIVSLGRRAVAPMSRTGLPTEDEGSGDPESDRWEHPEYAAVHSPELGFQLIIRRTLSPSVGLWGAVAGGGVLPRGSISTVESSRSLHGDLFRLQSLRLAAGPRFNTPDTRVLNIAFETAAWVGAIWGGSVSTSSGEGNDEWRELTPHEAAVLVGVDAAIPGELELSRALVFRAGPSVSLAYFVHSPTIPEVVGTHIWWGRINAGFVFRW